MDRADQSNLLLILPSFCPYSPQPLDTFANRHFINPGVAQHEATALFSPNEQKIAFLTTDIKPIIFRRWHGRPTANSLPTQSKMPPDCSIFMG
jgi:hypothetical protein